MTDAIMLHNNCWEEPQTGSEHLSVDDKYMYQLSQRIALKQSGIKKIEEAILILGDFQKRLCRVIALLPSTEDRKLRENQVYNALNYYLYGDSKEAVRYARAAGKKPESWLSRLRYGSKIRKSMLQLRWMFNFIDEKNCRQKIQNRRDNEDFCTALDLMLNMRLSRNSAVEFLQRKMFSDYKILKELKNLKQKNDTPQSPKIAVLSRSVSHFPDMSAMSAFSYAR